MTNYVIFNINNLTNEAYEYYYSLMANDKKLKIQKFRFDDDKKRSVAGEMLARQMISEKCGMAENEIKFQTEQNGKPFCSNSNIQFNISHSQNLVCCAVSNKKIGVDIECMLEDNYSSAKVFCTEKEMQYIFDENISDTERKQRFFSVWTFKEAYSKMTGTGLKSEFKNIDYFKEKCIRKITDAYCLSICTESIPPVKRVVCSRAISP